MKIQELGINNFHGFEHKVFEFNENFTVLIGENGTGKTAILDAISVAIGGFLLGLNDVDSRNIRSDEVRLKQTEHGKIINIEPQYPVTIKSTAIFNDNIIIQWERTLNSKSGRTTRINALDIINYSKKMQKKVASGNEVILPVFAYHGTGRLWAHIKDTGDNLFETGSRFLGYKNCLNPISNEKLFLKWFKKMTLIEIQENIKLGQFHAVKKAIEECLKGLIVDNKESSDVKVLYNLNRDELQVNLEDGRRLPFGLLSDGYRNIIGIVADIAFRMAVLNPFLEECAVQQTTGIVLIDEIDLHLHPEWQRKVIGDFKRTFPRIQFIVTTHSPFIIQSLDQGELIDLDSNNGINKFIDYTNMSVEDITEDIMGVELPQWSIRKKEMYEAAKKYFKILNIINDENDTNVQELKAKLDELTKPFIEDVGFMAFLEQKRVVMEAKYKGEKL